MNQSKQIRPGSKLAAVLSVATIIMVCLGILYSAIDAVLSHPPYCTIHVRDEAPYILCNRVVDFEVKTHDPDENMLCETSTEATWLTVLHDLKLPRRKVHCTVHDRDMGPYLVCDDVVEMRFHRGDPKPGIEFFGTYLLPPETLDAKKTATGGYYPRIPCLH